MPFGMMADIFYDVRDVKNGAGTSIIVPITRMFDRQACYIQSVSVVNFVTAASKCDIGIYRGVDYDYLETITLTTIGDYYIFNWSGYLIHPMFLVLNFTDCVAADTLKAIIHGITLKNE